MNSNFIDALRRRDIEAIRRCPKSDLHNHAYLGGERKHLESLTGKTIPALSRKIATMSDMHRWVEKHIQPVLPSNSLGRETAYKATFHQAKMDGVVVLDFCEDIWTKTLFRDSAKEMTNVIKRCHREVAPMITIRPTLGISRHCSVETILEWFEPFLELDYYRAIDLYGDEFAQPISNFKNIYRRAKEEGMVLKAHVGEWGDAASVQEAVETLELDEVQHGISVAQSVDTMKWLSNHNIQLNICPTSNIMLGRVKHYSTHPIRTIFDHGIKVTINTDDVLVFGQGVSEEYLNLFCAQLFSEQELDDIRQQVLPPSP